ncbi:MAG: ATP-dependent zinc metalloprotease FtsH [Filifactoraceae bacterium]
MKKAFKGASLYILIFAFILLMVRFLGTPNQEVKQLAFSEFYQSLIDGNVKEIQLVENNVKGILKNDGVEFKTLIPYAIDTKELSAKILEQADAGTLKVEGIEAPRTPWYVELLPSILLIGGMAVIWFFFMQQSQGGGKMNNFGKSRAKLHNKDDGRPKVTFKDVAGLDEEKEELEEIVEFLKNPKRYIELGARIPKGMLMVGPPGTGKTYLTKAVAGEAGVPFFSISGSDFVEMFVGVGASRVRDLFEQAKKASPCVIFIDEIDAVGRKRGAGLGGGHDEREQTLNQLLVEMDGFGINEGIIIMAATNRPDILDPALLRPGRFDRQVMVGTPDIRGREAILKVHSKNKPLSTGVDLKVIARSTAGFTPADLENLMNEAALLTARLKEKTIRMETIQEAIIKVVVGVAKKSRVISDEEKKLTAYHEAGHAIVATLLPNSDPVHQVTIIPRGMAGGFTMSLPTEDRYYATKTELKEELLELLGGRVAEMLVLGDISTGASNDLERVAAIARNMVTKYAMTDSLGAMAYGDDHGEVFLGKDFSTKRNYSEEVASQIDHEIKVIVDEAYEKTVNLISENMDKLHNVAKALLVYETLDAEEFKLAYEGTLDLTIDILEERKKAEEKRIVLVEEGNKKNMVDKTENQSKLSDEEARESLIEPETSTEKEAFGDDGENPNESEIPDTPIEIEAFGDKE